MIRSTFTTSAGDVSIVVDGSTSPHDLVVLAHGAGAPLDSPFMGFFAEHLATGDTAVARFNFVYMEQGRRTPGPQAVAEQTYAEVAEHLRSSLRPARLFVGGKSYGGRIATHIAAASTSVDGLVLLGYPLHPPGKPERIRDAHLGDIEAPILFVEGTRDPFCPLPTLNRVVERLSGRADLIVIEGGDHSLKVPRSSGRTTEQAWAEACTGISDWLLETR